MPDEDVRRRRAVAYERVCGRRDAASCFARDRKNRVLKLFPAPPPLGIIRDEQARVFAAVQRPSS